MTNTNRTKMRFSPDVPSQLRSTIERGHGRRPGFPQRRIVMCWCDAPLRRPKRDSRSQADRQALSYPREPEPLDVRKPFFEVKVELGSVAPADGVLLER